MQLYFFNFIYLAAFFGILAWYRRLILAEYDIPYLQYGVALLEAFILAKIIMVADWVGLGQHPGRWPCRCRYSIRPLSS